MSPLDSSVRPPINPIQPGAYSGIDASQVSGQGRPTGPLIAILGQTAGGQPNVLQRFTDPQALKNRLRSGAAFDCARFAMGVGSNPVAVMRVGNGILQSSKALQNAGAATVVTLTSLDYGAWTANIKVTVAANNNITITYQDPATGVTYTETYNLGAAATAQNITDAINGKLVGYNPSQYVAAVVGGAAAPLATAAITPLVGGSDGALVSGDWTTGLAVLEGEQPDIVVAATGDATVHAQIETHCNNMSVSAARRERVAVHGGVLGETVSQAVTRMASLTKRSQLVFPGVQDYDAVGTLKTWDPFYAAAKVAALHATLPDPATSLIHAPVPCVDLELVGSRYLSTAPGSDVDTLLRGNVTPIVPAPGGGVWVVDSLSGWTTDDSFRDFHKVRTADFVQQRLRNRLESQFVGKKALNATANSITDDAQKELEALQTETIIRASGAVNVQQGSDARTVNVTAPVLLPDATKYIFIVVALQSPTPLNRVAAVSDDALL